MEEIEKLNKLIDESARISGVDTQKTESYDFVSRMLIGKYDYNPIDALREYYQQKYVMHFDKIRKDKKI